MNKASTIRIASWNVRGLRNLQKQQAVLRCFQEEDLDILCLQETWLNRASCLEWEDNVRKEELWSFSTTQKSNDTKGEGVTVIVRKRHIVNVQVMLKQHWADNSVALLIHVSPNSKKD